MAYDDFLHTKFVNNIEYLGAGYNIIFGNPLSTREIDPGYKDFNAFEYHYQDSILDSLTTDADYFVPDHVNLKTKTACDISFSSQEMSTMTDYQESLDVSLSVSYKGVGSKFSGNAEYKQTERDI